MSTNSFTKTIPYLFVLLQGVLYGFGDPISKVAYETMPVYSLLTARYLIASVFMLILCRKRFFTAVRNTSVRTWLLPSFCIAMAYILGNVALVLTEATTVAFLRQLATIFTPILAYIFYRKRYGWKHVPVQVFVVAGLYLLCGMGGLSGFGAGEIVSLITAVLAAGALVFGEKALDSMDVMVLTTLQCMMSMVLSFGFAVVLEGGVHLEAATPSIWAVILYLGLLCTVAGYLLQNAAMKSISSSSVAILQCLCPVMTAFFSRLLLGEILSLAGMAGAGLILVCCIAETMLQQDNKKVEEVRS